MGERTEGRDGRRSEEWSGRMCMCDAGSLFPFSLFGFYNSAEREKSAAAAVWSRRLGDASHIHHVWLFSSASAYH